MANLRYWMRHNPKIPAQEIYEESATQKHPLGTSVTLADGRSFRYCKNAGVAQSVGMLLQTAVIDTLATSMVLNTAAVVGDDHIHVTYGAGTTAVANYFKEGYAIIAETTVAVGAGNMYKIKKHAAATSGGSLTIYLDEDVRVACTVTTAQVSCVKHPCGDVVVFPTTNTGVAVGVTPIPVTANYYFWAQYKGPCPCLVDTGDTLVVGTHVQTSTGATVAGAVTTWVENTETELIGVAWSIGAADSFAIINLNIP